MSRSFEILLWGLNEFSNRILILCKVGVSIYKSNKEFTNKIKSLLNNYSNVFRNRSIVLIVKEDKIRIDFIEG